VREREKKHCVWSSNLKSEKWRAISVCVCVCVREREREREEEMLHLGFLDGIFLGFGAPMWIPKTWRAAGERERERERCRRSQNTTFGFSE
jgi:hypothetical protein